ncbi:(2Fe-2S)-binding protein [Mammaliicoccus vitulinus]|uniref:(2Fe-2S)-binding protein n=1 Tax=Mammaliicoccus vitulinus TaxID=71237 RepID=UPI00248CAE5B|nr:(2Fe-2S)-binding protein [Mammaliicoccus vitulinus]
MTDRIINHKILDDIDLNMVPFTWNNKILYGNEGESITAALLSNNIRKLREHEKDSQPRGMYCNIGHCSECRVTINGKKNQRACLTSLTKDMMIEQQFEVPYVVKEGSPYV